VHELPATKAQTLDRSAPLSSDPPWRKFDYDRPGTTLGTDQLSRGDPVPMPRTAEQRDKLAPYHVGRGLPSRSGGDILWGSVYRILSLPRGGGGKSTRQT
jgi:hypothetical protein